MIGWRVCDPFFGCQGDEAEPYLCSEDFCTEYVTYKIIKSDGTEVVMQNPSVFILDMNDTAYLWHVIFQRGYDNPLKSGTVSLQYKDESGQWAQLKTFSTNIYGSVVITFKPTDLPQVPSRSILFRTVVVQNSAQYLQEQFTVMLNISKVGSAIIKTSPVGNPVRIPVGSSTISGKLLDVDDNPIAYRDIVYSLDGVPIGTIRTTATGAWQISIVGASEAPDKQVVLEFVGDSLYYASSLVFNVFVPCSEGAYKDAITCPDGSQAYQNVCSNGRFITNPAQCECVPGETALPVVCSDGVTRYFYSCDENSKWIQNPAPCPKVCNEGEYHTLSCDEGFTIVTEICQGNKWVPTGDACPTRTCEEGATKVPVVCPDGTTVYNYICQNGQWVSTNHPCPPFVCDHGDIRMTECADGSSIISERCFGNKWLETGEECPTVICTEGAKKNPLICGDGSKIYEQVCHNNQWGASGEQCPQGPPSTELIKYLPYIALAGVGGVGLVLLMKR